MKTWAIPRGLTSLHYAYWISGESIDLTGRSRTALREKSPNKAYEDKRRSSTRVRRRPHGSKLVEGLIAENGQRFVGVGNRQDDERPFPFP